MGVLNWFPVHGTALNNTVTVISSDNKGVASQLFEKYIASKRRSVASMEKFVAAFGQSNSADVSPNTEGAYCLDTGLQCDVSSSTCNARSELCNGRGPGWPDCFKSSFLIGQRQFDKAKELFETPTHAQELEPEIDYRHVFLNMSEITIEGSGNAKTCRPALGYSFAAGTTDGGTRVLTLIGRFFVQVQACLILFRVRHQGHSFGVSSEICCTGHQTRKLNAIVPNPSFSTLESLTIQSHGRKHERE